MGLLYKYFPKVWVDRARGWDDRIPHKSYYDCLRQPANLRCNEGDLMGTSLNIPESATILANINPNLTKCNVSDYCIVVYSGYSWNCY